jgi:hypothetical protein
LRCVQSREEVNTAVYHAGKENLDRRKIYVGYAISKCNLRLVIEEAVYELRKLVDYIDGLEAQR